MVRYDLNLFEVWKPIPGYPDYDVSSEGRIWSKKSGRFLHTRTNEKGYVICNLKNNGNEFTKKLHRIIAEAFIPNPNNLPQVNHKDEDKSNNNVENLEWCTAKYNCNYGSRIKRQIETKIKKGIYNPLTAGIDNKNERDSVYNLIHKDHIQAYQKKWKEDHKEYIQKYNRKYYEILRKNRTLY